MVKPLNYSRVKRSRCQKIHQSIMRATYQQALDDFAIIPLLQKLILIAPGDLEVEERESLAALLIEQLTASLDSSLISQCINSILLQDGDVISDRIAIELSRLSASHILHEDFPDDLPTAAFEIGDKVQWKLITDARDRGIVIGRFYSYGQHRYGWGWKYVIWLTQDSPSSAWIVADTAWEEDLQRQLPRS